MLGKKKGRPLFTIVMILAMVIWAGTIVYAQMPKTINLLIDGEEKKVVTGMDKLADALEEAAYTNLEGAEISLPLDSQVQNGMELEIRTLKRVTLKAGDNIKEVVTNAVSVRELLDEEKIYLDNDDRIRPGRNSKLENGARVEADFVEESVISSSVEIPFEKEVKKTEDLNLGVSKVETEGVAGSRQVITRQVKVNGRISKEEVLSDKITKEPINEVTLEGTYDPTPRSPKLYSLRQFMFNGVVYYQGYKFTYYSQSVLPGGGLNIPGRHINEDGYVADGDGYIVLAGSAARGTVFATPFGYYGKIYDRGTYGNHLDVYTR